jgi:hypothetical protein
MGPGRVKTQGHIVSVEYSKVIAACESQIILRVRDSMLFHIFSLYEFSHSLGHQQKGSS